MEKDSQEFERPPCNLPIIIIYSDPHFFAKNLHVKLIVP